MIHDLDALERELHRVQSDAKSGYQPPTLARFTVKLSGLRDVYSQRVCSVLSAALSVGITEDSDEDIPTAGLPDWFVQICETPDAAPSFARDGRSLYLSRVAASPWSIQDWLYRFTPDEESRGWSWWGLTYGEASEAHLWVDSWGESFFGCDDLRWLACTAGAMGLEGPIIEKLEKWENESYGTR